MDKYILTKKPFLSILPGTPYDKVVTGKADPVFPRAFKGLYQVSEQIDFLRQYDIRGHIINSPEYYPDRVKYNEEKDEYYKEYMFRAAFPFQKMILIQHLVHLCGNDLHHELTGAHNTDSENELFMRLRTGMLNDEFELAFYQLARGTKKTGDAAVCFFIKDKKVRWKAFAYDLGDTLFPHYGDDGELETFARMYDTYDAKGEAVTTFVEVWDKTNMTRYRRDNNGIVGFVNDIKDYLGLDDFTIDMKPTPHGFKEVPIVYQRDDDGPCWHGSQDAIDKYELAISNLCQNNMAYAFPIMVLNGDDIEIKADMYGAVKAIDAGANGKASYLEPQGNIEAFKLQLEVLLKLIFQGSFAVLPPEVRSGDMPGVSIKLIYSPSIDMAINDSKVYAPALDKMMRLYKWGLGIEIEKARELSNLGTYSWIEPYVHQNMTELVNNLVQLTNTGLLSHKTGCQLHGYGANNEEDIIITEYKQQQAADLLYEMNKQPKDADGDGILGEQ